MTLLPQIPTSYTDDPTPPKWATHRCRVCGRAYQKQGDAYVDEFSRTRAGCACGVVIRYNAQNLKARNHEGDAD